MRRKILILAACIFLFSLNSHAQFEPGRPAGFVNDFAHVIDAGTANRLESLLERFERATSIEIAVVTVPAMNGVPIEDYAETLFKKWGIGKKGKDSGLLFLIAKEERKARIETGYGLEGVMNDAAAGRILDEAAVPYFRQGDYSAGIMNGLLKIIAILSQRMGIDFGILGLDQAHPADEDVKDGSLIGKIFRVIFIIFLVILFIRNPWMLIFFLGMGRGGGFRGFGGGGFGGFGGGMSGGGGASRGW